MELKVLKITKEFLNPSTVIIEVKTKNNKKKYRLRVDDVLEIVEDSGG